MSRQRHKAQLATAQKSLRAKIATSGDDALLTEYEGAAYLGKSIQWMRNKRCYGGGPPTIKVGSGVRYRYGNLKAYLQPPAPTEQQAA